MANDVEYGSASVAVVVPTYGDRSALCSQVVSAALKEGVGRILVVQNGASSTADAELGRLTTRHGGRVKRLTFEQPLGSAAAYAAGIAAVLGGDNVRWLWLLDDDNIPDRGALAELLNCTRGLRAGGHAFSALASLRIDRPRMREAASAGASCYPSASSFLYFNCVDRAFRRRRDERNWDPTDRRIRALPYGPYGGLFVRPEMLNLVGLPDERFVVYEDDAEFTSRLAAHAPLYVVPSSVIRDVERSWSQETERGNGLTRLLNASSDVRCYYAVRNRVYLESHLWKRSTLLYRLNRAVVVALLWILGTAMRKPERVELLRKAISDGERGVLGTSMDINKI